MRDLPPWSSKRHTIPMPKSKIKKLIEGRTHHDVMLETCLDAGISRPRVRPVSDFSRETRVEFPRSLRSKYPLETRFRATVKVCQKHWLHNGQPKGPPYLRASDIYIQRAVPRPGSKSGRAYDQIWEKIS